MTTGTGTPGMSTVFFNSISTTRYLNRNVLTSLLSLPFTESAISCSPRVSVFATVPLNRICEYFAASVVPVFPVCLPPLYDVAVTPVGSPLWTLISWIIPELSHALIVGLNVAPLNTVKIGAVAVCPRDWPFKVACGLELSATLNVTSFVIRSGA